MKKKKHGFLKFWVKVILFVAVVVLVKRTGEYFVGKEFEQFRKDYPFEFTGADYVKYVTTDFTVTNVYTDAKGKEHNTVWTSDNKCIVLGDNKATVTRPDKATVTVTLTETYKKLLWKVSRSYDIIVAPRQTIVREDINVITLEQVQNGEYNKDMQILLDDGGSVEFMLGDFKDTYVYCEADAIEVLNAYKGQFGIESDIEFMLRSVNSAITNKKYMFDIGINGIKVMDCSADVVVNIDTNQVEKISIDAEKADSMSRNIPMDTEKVLEHEAIIQNYVNTSDAENSGYEYLVFEGDRLIFEDRFVATYLVYFKNGCINNIYIDVNTGEVLKYFRNESDITKITTVPCYTYTLEGEKVMFSGTEVKASGTNVEINAYTPINMEKKIGVLENTSDYIYYNAAKEAVEEGKWWNLGAMLYAPLNRKLGLEDTSLIINETNEFYEGQNSLYGLQFYNLEKMYDFMKNTLGINSFDNKGTGIKVLTNSKYTNLACWQHDINAVVLGHHEKLMYPCGCDPVSIGHEIGHGIFSQHASGGGEEMGGLNEAYADIFGCLAGRSWIVGKNKLKDGTDVYFRDLENIKNPDMTQLGDPTCRTYKDENWNGESHTISTVISQIACKMAKSELFGYDLTARIWYNSLGYGYNNEERPYFTCYMYVINAAMKMGCSPEQLDFIRWCFFEAGVTRPRLFSTQEYQDRYEEATKDKEDSQTENRDENDPLVIESKSESIPGDIMLDDDITNEYFIFYSEISMVLGDGSGMYIYQAGGNNTEAEIQQLTEKINTRVNELNPNINIHGNPITIEYEQVDQLKLKVIRTISEKSGKMVQSFALQGLELEESDLKSEDYSFLREVLKAAIDTRYVKSTAYDLFDGMGIIE